MNEYKKGKKKKNLLRTIKGGEGWNFKIRDVPQ